MYGMTTSRAGLLCWGSGEFGQHGHGRGPTGDNAGEPIGEAGKGQVEMLDESGVKLVACGASHTIVVTESNRIYAWGNGHSGQLGTGSRDTEWTPKRVFFPSSTSTGDRTTHNGHISPSELCKADVSKDTDVKIATINRYLESNDIPDIIDNNISNNIECFENYDISKANNVNIPNNYLSYAVDINNNEDKTTHKPGDTLYHNSLSNVSDLISFEDDIINSYLSKDDNTPRNNKQLSDTNLHKRSFSNKNDVSHSHGVNNDNDVSIANCKNPDVKSTKNSTDGVTIIGVSCGARHSALLTSSGCVYVCGSNDRGQLGLPRDPNSLIHVELTKIPDLRDRVRGVSCGDNRTVMLLESGEVAIAGKMTTNNHTHETITYIDPPSHVTTITSGSNHYLAVTDEGVVLEITDVTSTRLHCVTGHVIQVAAGMRHSAALTDAGEVYTWGSGEHGQLGHGPGRTATDRPTRVHNLPRDVIYIACGEMYTAAVTEDGNLFMWGENRYVITPKLVTSSPTPTVKSVTSESTAVLTSHVVWEPMYISTNEQRIVSVHCGIWHIVAIVRSQDTEEPCTNRIPLLNSTEDTASSDQNDENTSHHKYRTAMPVMRVCITTTVEQESKSDSDDPCNDSRHDSRNAWVTSLSHYDKLTKTDALTDIHGTATLDTTLLNNTQNETAPLNLGTVKSKRLCREKTDFSQSFPITTQYQSRFESHRYRSATNSSKTIISSLSSPSLPHINKKSKSQPEHSQKSRSPFGLKEPLLSKRDRNVMNSALNESERLTRDSTIWEPLRAQCPDVLRTREPTIVNFREMTFLGADSLVYNGGFDSLRLRRELTKHNFCSISNDGRGKATPALDKMIREPTEVKFVRREKTSFGESIRLKRNISPPIRKRRKSETHSLPLIVGNQTSVPVKNTGISGSLRDRHLFGRLGHFSYLSGDYSRIGQLLQSKKQM